MGNEKIHNKCYGKLTPVYGKSKIEGKKRREEYHDNAKMDVRLLQWKTFGIYTEGTLA